MISFFSQPCEKKLTQQASYLAVFIAGLLVMAKGAGYWATASLGLQASLFDSLFDITFSLLNIVIIKIALAPPDIFHRFGHGKAVALAAFAQSFFIAFLSVLLVIKIIERFLHPVPIQNTSWGLCIMGISIFLTYFLVSYQNYVIKRTKNISIIADRAHYQADLLENISVFISFIVVQVSSIFWIDSFLGIFIIIYILKTAWNIGRDAINVLMDHEIEQKERKEIFSIISDTTGVQEIQDFRTRASNMRQFVQCRVVLDGNLPLTEVACLLNSIERKICEKFPQAESIIQPVTTPSCFEKDDYDLSNL